uniref:Sulfatase N-terminal domain-containing protein n=1 Tax=Knipowitschia caucasica TaxID=637954 RepID=A0AAV2L7D9_KNICA
MVDDLGIGDLGCFGNKTLRTPHIDSLASDGARLTHHIAAAPLCSPSRAAFLTGRLPVRSGTAGSGQSMVFLFNAASGGLPPSEVTFASVLQQQGYNTALVGKWHLGLNCISASDRCHHPNSHGFHYFFGIPLTNLRDCHPGHGTVFRFHKFVQLKTWAPILLIASLAFYFRLIPFPRLILVLTAGPLVFGALVLYGCSFLVPYMNCILMRNAEIMEQPFSTVNLTQRMTSEAVGFMERSRGGPFLLFVTYLQVHTALFAHDHFRGSSPHGIYGDAVHEVDWSVGQILRSLDQLGLRDDTVVYLTSDQGAHLEEVTFTGERHGGSNGIYRAGKSTNFEGGIRVPGLVRWPGTVSPGLVIDAPTSLMDLFPTVLQLSGGRLPHDRVIDGRSLLDLLTAKSQRSEHEFMFHYCTDVIQAVRWIPTDSSSVWKLFYFTPIFDNEHSSTCFHSHVCFCHEAAVKRHNPPLLFDLSRDPTESQSLTPDSEPEFWSIVDRMTSAVWHHQATLEATPNQMAMENMIPRLSLQPCCSTFTELCRCKRNASKVQATESNWEL